MGQGGHIALINGTNYRWRRASIHSYQMNSWSFPDFIEPFSKAQVYVEWQESIIHTSSDDSGHVQYVIDQAGGRSFQIQARYRHIQVLIENFTVPGHGKGSVIDLGWNHDGTMIFVLAGRADEHSNDEFLSTGSDMSNWMKSQMGIIGDMTLRQLCMGGAHDAGMSVSHSPTAFASSSLVLTQTKSIRDQLTAGARYFDIRPIIGGGDYFTGHYSHITEINSYQGARGQSIQDVVNQLNDFTSKYSGELIILSLSHSFNTDLGNNSYRPLNTVEWNRLIQRLKGINHLFISQDSRVDLTTIQMKKFFEKGASVVVVVIEKNGQLQLKDDAGKGFFIFPDNYQIFDDYADKYDINEMMRDQFGKMCQPANHANKLFLLSWICTPKSIGDSVLVKAYEANQSLCEIFPNSTRQLFPNIILTDRFESTNETSIAIAINNRNHSQ